MEKNKVVFNDCYGGFGLSKEAKALYKELSGKEYTEGYDSKATPRHCKYLVKVVETLKEKASDNYAKLKVEETGCFYRIQEYDGTEWVETPDDIKWEKIPSPGCIEEYPEHYL